MRHARIALLLLATCLVNNCGQKGALYLPGDREPVASGSATASPAPESAPAPATSTPPATVPSPPPGAATTPEERDENTARNRGR